MTRYQVGGYYGGSYQHYILWLDVSKNDSKSTDTKTYYDVAIGIKNDEDTYGYDLYASMNFKLTYSGKAHTGTGNTSGTLYDSSYSVSLPKTANSSNTVYTTVEYFNRRSDGIDRDIIFTVSVSGSWYSISQGTTVYQSATVSSSKYIVQAQNNKYNITIHPCYGTLKAIGSEFGNKNNTSEDVILQTTVGSSDICAIGICEKTGYKFAGYFTESGGKGLMVYNDLGRAVRNTIYFGSDDKYKYYYNLDLYAYYEPEVSNTAKMKLQIQNVYFRMKDLSHIFYKDDTNRFSASDGYTPKRDENGKLYNENKELIDDNDYPCLINVRLRKKDFFVPEEQIIQFTIKRWDLTGNPLETYSATTEMTWEEWVDSDYNINGFVLINGYIYPDEDNNYCIAEYNEDDSSAMTLSTSIIKDGYEYWTY